MLTVWAVLHCSGLGCVCVNCPRRRPAPRRSQGAGTDDSGNWRGRRWRGKKNKLNYLMIIWRSKSVKSHFLPITDLLNFLPDLVSPERDEKHNTFADFTLEHRSASLKVLHKLTHHCWHVHVHEEVLNWKKETNSRCQNQWGSRPPLRSWGWCNPCTLATTYAQKPPLSPAEWDRKQTYRQKRWNSLS